MQLALSLPIPFSAVLLLFGAITPPVIAQSSSSCSFNIQPTRSIQTSIASGYQAAVVATGVAKARTLQFDSAGNLLVLQGDIGVSSFQLDDHGGTCVGIKSRKNVIQNKEASFGYHPFCGI